ncbi:MAG: toprim domain-containing protein [Bacteroidia bacterium]
MSVFEGFFDFISYESMNKNQRVDLTGLPNRHMNFLILNSLSFFERSILLMEKHENIHLFLDHDNAGRKYTNLALKRSLNFKDESKLYAGYKDLNDWIINFGKLEQKIYVGQKRGRHL